MFQSCVDILLPSCNLCCINRVFQFETYLKHDQCLVWIQSLLREKFLLLFYLSTVRSRIEINFREQKQSFHFLHILIGAVASIHSIAQMNPQKTC